MGIVVGTTEIEDCSPVMVMMFPDFFTAKWENYSHLCVIIMHKAYINLVMVVLYL